MFQNPTGHFLQYSSHQQLMGSINYQAFYALSLRCQ